VNVVNPWICRSHTRRTGETIAWMQKIALTLEVLVGALITALGAALRGPSVRCIIILILALYLPDIDARQTSRLQLSGLRRHLSHGTCRARGTRTSRSNRVSAPGTWGIFCVRLTCLYLTMGTNPGTCGRIRSMASAAPWRKFLGLRVRRRTLTLAEEGGQTVMQVPTGMGECNIFSCIESFVEGRLMAQEPACQRCVNATEIKSEIWM